MGDIPEGFRLEYDLGETNGRLKVNISVRTVVAESGKNYMRWTGDMVGEVIESESQQSQEDGGGGGGSGSKREMREHDAQSSSSSSLVGVAVLEQFVMVE